MSGMLDVGCIFENAGFVFENVDCFFADAGAGRFEVCRKFENAGKKLKKSINECLKPNNGCLMPGLEGLRFIKILETPVKKLKKPTD